MKHETNEEFIVRMMNFAKSGPLMQAFIIDSLTKHAERCADVDASVFDSPMLNGEAWKACAVELKSELDKKYGGKP